MWVTGMRNGLWIGLVSDVCALASKNRGNAFQAPILALNSCNNSPAFVSWRGAQNMFTHKLHDPCLHAKITLKKNLSALWIENLAKSL